MLFKADSTVCDEIRPSPNFGARAADVPLDMLILHYTGMPDGEAALQWLCSEKSQVSCHYFIFEDGRTVQLVAEEARAWHAGASYWKGKTDINSQSIGIEIDNPGHEHGYRAFPEAQIATVITLCKDICDRRQIVSENILAHSDVAPERKEDPGELFPWERLAGEGIGLWTSQVPLTGGRFLQEGDQGQPVEALQSMLGLYGFDLRVSGNFDHYTKTCVEAFQRHHRQVQVDGIADMSTITSLHQLLKLRSELV
ncbi:MAG: N-acetylmuramoyl-L-alanine amidase [Stappiaceae bacterium]